MNIRVKQKIKRIIGLHKVVKVQEPLPSRYFNKEAFDKMDEQLKWDTIDNYLTLKNIGGI
jgi:hypothetical protein